ncbi:hypothetical protein D910_10395 [Dendroctonus ponderosae]|uniref:Uncharacterized protein n=1 Tax=Dendroctonus ponderosae TaxID=77166 RepID=U4UKT2_DENPD|nr:hypothetical protein D910_10395 [Dendroctonus ponderosae]
MRAEQDTVSFFRFSETNRGERSSECFASERRNACVKALKRVPLTEIYMRNDRICLGHFITGKPAALQDKTNPDVLPNENLGNICSLPAAVFRFDLKLFLHGAQEFDSVSQFIEEICAKQIYGRCVSESVQTDVPN